MRKSAIFLLCLFALSSFGAKITNMDTETETSVAGGAVDPGPSTSFQFPRRDAIDLETGIGELRQTGWSHYMNRFKSNQALVEHLIAFLGEYVGTTMFIFLAFAPVNYINTHMTDAPSALMYNSLAFGFALAITARAFSAGHFNGGVTLAMAMLKIVTPFRALLLGVAQYTGSLTGAGVVRLLTGSLATLTRKTPLINVGQALVLEGLATTAFIFSILMVAAKAKRVNLLAPLEIGLSLFITELVSIGFSGGALNPNRALASDIVAKDYASYSWIYTVAPFAGGALAAGIYKFFEQIQRLQEVVPDADAGITLAAVTTQTDGNSPWRRGRSTSLANHPSHSRHTSKFDNTENLVVSPLGQNFPVHTD